MALANLTVDGLTIAAPSLGTPAASFYSILATGPLRTAKPILGTPKMIAFRYWSIPVNWERAVTEEVSYRTEVITSRDGTEQRIAQRVNPRYRFNFGIRVAMEDAALLERLLAKRQAYNYAFDHPRATMLADRGHPGANGFIGRLDREASVTARTDRVLEMEVGVLINPGVYVRDYLTGYTHPAADTFHNGLEVLTLSANWASPVRLNFGQMTEILDRERGVNDFFVPERFTNRIVQCELMLRNEAEEDRLRGLFERMRGQQGEFYMVDPLSAQIVITANVPAAATHITVPGEQVFQRFGGQDIYRSIAIRTRAGMIYRRVSAIALVGGNSRITVTAGLPEIQLTDIIGIHWLLKYRFATDGLLLSWETDSTARVGITLRALEDA